MVRTAVEASFQLTHNAGPEAPLNPHPNFSLNAMRLSERSNLSKNRRDWSFDSSLGELFEVYGRDGSPIEVDFRKLVPLNSGIDRHSHLIHPYPAKLLLNIPLYFLACTQLCQPSSVVYDPFCGSGTVLLESILSGRNAVGSDANPLARLIAKVKTCRIEHKYIEQKLADILGSFENCTPTTFSKVVDPRRWYSADAISELGRLLASIRENCVGDVLDFMEICFSSVARKTSLCDPRISVPVRLKGDSLLYQSNNPPSVPGLFCKVVQQNAARIANLPLDDLTVTIDADARTRAAELEESVDLVITSPPYAGAQKYIRSSTLALGWLGLAPDSKLRNLERQNIGREHFEKAEIGVTEVDERLMANDALQAIGEINPLRAHIAAKYLEEMAVAASAIAARLKPGGHLVLVVGDNLICGKPFTTTGYLRRVFELQGLCAILELVDTIKSRGLMTSRNKTAGTIEREHVFVLKKPVR